MITVNASSKRPTLWSVGKPNASNSGSCQPAPIPRISRPSLTASSVAAILASTAGLRNAVQITIVPRLTRAVASAMAERIVHDS